MAGTNGLVDVESAARHRDTGECRNGVDVIKEGAFELRRVEVATGKDERGCP